MITWNKNITRITWNVVTWYIEHHKDYMEHQMDHVNHSVLLLPLTKLVEDDSDFLPMLCGQNVSQEGRFS